MKTSTHRLTVAIAAAIARGGSRQRRRRGNDDPAHRHGGRRHDGQRLDRRGQRSRRPARGHGRAVDPRPGTSPRARRHGLQGGRRRLRDRDDRGRRAQRRRRHPGTDVDRRGVPQRRCRSHRHRHDPGGPGRLPGRRQRRGHDTRRLLRGDRSVRGGTRRGRDDPRTVDHRQSEPATVRRGDRRHPGDHPGRRRARDGVQPFGSQRPGRPRLPAGDRRRARARRSRSPPSPTPARSPRPPRRSSAGASRRSSCRRTRRPCRVWRRWSRSPTTTTSP